MKKFITYYPLLDGRENILSTIYTNILTSTKELATTQILSQIFLLFENDWKQVIKVYYLFYT